MTHRLFFLLVLLLILPALTTCGQTLTPTPPPAPATAPAAVAAAPIATPPTRTIGATPATAAIATTRATPARATPALAATPGAIRATATRAASPAARASATPNLEDTLPVGFVDQRQQRYLQVALTDGQPDYGLAWFAIPGVGFLSATRPARVTTTGPSRVALDYDGPAFLDAAAKLRASNPFFTQPGGAAAPVTIRVVATLDPTTHTGEIALDYAGQTYLFHCTTPPHDADGTLQAVVAAMNRADWAAQYRLSSQYWHDHMSEAEFVAWVTSAQQGVGTVSAVRVVGPLDYQTGRDGVQYATTTIALTVTRAGVTTTEQEPLILIYEADGWRFATTIPNNPTP